jgi:S-methylmethionine-dependent homocysteine/selenocysteine methylase
MLPQLSGDRLFLTDGGLETTLIFHQGLDLPYFAAFPLLEHEAGAEAVRRYFEPYLAIARERGTGIVLDSPTWRANRDWAERLGYSPEELAEANRRAVALVEGLCEPDVPAVLNGVVGPRGDGYVVGEAMSAAEAEAYHAEQIGTFAGTAADMVSAITMTYVDEAIGITRAAQAAGLPAVISFTVETDGRLPSGQPLREAVEQVDAETGSGPAYFMVNCAHPSHFADALEDGPWLERIGGLRANASTMSHAELDEATELDEGDPAQLATDYRALRERLPKANVLGGCCGTDHRHIAAISEAWVR